MKQLKYIFIIILISLPAFIARAQSITDMVLALQSQTIEGRWNGTMQVGQQKLTMVFDIDTAKNEVSFGVVEQGAMGIPATVEFLGPDSISVKSEMAHCTYTGKLQSGILKGKFAQNGYEFPLDLTHGDIKFSRPQEPKEPFPYKTEEVRFRNEAAGVELAGTLNWPEGYKDGDKVPVVLFITGSGKQNRYEGLFGHKPFLVLSDALAKAGIASLTYDDRGAGSSTGDFNASNVADFAEDAAAGLAFLRNIPAFSKVGVIGHSEGGLIAYMLASQKKTDFIVSMAGPAMPIDSLIFVQLNTLGRLQGAGNDVFKSVAQARQYMMAANGNSPATEYFLNIKPSEYVSKVTCPVLALGGSLDPNVPAEINFKALKANLPGPVMDASGKDLGKTLSETAYAASGTASTSSVAASTAQGAAAKARYVMKLYPGLNHLFQHARTGNPMEISSIEETISPEVITDIITWIISICNN
jgi:pimeloyl-ACP methyl ester carboxylesterase